jgi:hypothetical protein
VNFLAQSEVRDQHAIEVAMSGDNMVKSYLLYARDSSSCTRQSYDRRLEAPVTSGSRCPPPDQGGTNTS